MVLRALGARLARLRPVLAPATWRAADLSAGRRSPDSARRGKPPRFSGSPSWRPGQTPPPAARRRRVGSYLVAVVVDRLAAREVRWFFIACPTGARAAWVKISAYLALIWERARRPSAAGFRELILPFTPVSSPTFRRMRWTPVSSATTQRVVKRDVARPGPAARITERKSAGAPPPGSGRRSCLRRLSSGRRADAPAVVWISLARHGLSGHGQR